eukprot:2028553-Rhodomonas_salina.2
MCIRDRARTDRGAVCEREGCRQAPPSPPRSPSLSLSVCPCAHVRVFACVRVSVCVCVRACVRVHLSLSLSCSCSISLSLCFWMPGTHPASGACRGSRSGCQACGDFPYPPTPVLFSLHQS